MLGNTVERFESLRDEWERFDRLRTRICMRREKQDLTTTEDDVLEFVQHRLENLEEAIDHIFMEEL